MDKKKGTVEVAADILCTIIDLIIFFVGLITVNLIIDDNGFFDVFKAFLKHRYWDTDPRKMKCEITYSDEDEEDDI